MDNLFLKEDAIKIVNEFLVEMENKKQDVKEKNLKMKKEKNLKMKERRRKRDVNNHFLTSFLHKIKHLWLKKISMTNSIRYYPFLFKI
jgi:hypothetical protein